MISMDLHGSWFYLSARDETKALIAASAEWSSWHHTDAPDPAEQCSPDIWAPSTVPQLPQPSIKMVGVLHRERCPQFGRLHHGSKMM